MMLARHHLKLASCIALWAAICAARFCDASELQVSPARIQLVGRTAQQQLLVTELGVGRTIDRTRNVTFLSESPEIAAVDSSGLISAKSDGNARIIVRMPPLDAAVEVVVTGTQIDQSIDFERDVVPILTRYGCNSGPCHGKSGGQNGFQLSLLGFDPKFDHVVLSRESRGRRVFANAPERSLLLNKPTGEVPHGGGKRLQIGSPAYEMLRKWIAAGLPATRPETSRLTGVAVEPAECILGHDAAQQLVVTAKYSDGSTRDVTRLAAFQSNESGLASVNEEGLIKASTVVGDAAIMARYMGFIAVCNVVVPRADEVPEELYADLPRDNFIDRHLWSKLQQLRITPSVPASDEKFLRRATLDIIGRLPTVEEARAFLKDSAPDRRTALVDRLLERPEFADFWANKWADLLRPNPYRVGIKAVLNYDAWIRESFRQNKPYDQFVRELVTARGSTFRDGNVTLFRDRREPEELATITSQLFLGIRLECAKCHHHPFEVWGQDDFFGFAAYFAQVGRKGTGLSPPISGSEEMVFNAQSGTVAHPLTGAVLSPKPLFGTAREMQPGEDPRQVLAEWMTSRDNAYFGQVMANRVWADLMGRGLVEPVDDLRATNPASNAPLLAELGIDFRESGYDLKKLIRRICTSYAYGLSSLPNERNIADTRNYSRHYRQRLRAESLLDAVTTITGIPEEFDAMPAGSRAPEIWTHRVESLFLDAFGRPDPNQDPPCERTGDTTVVQALHLMNAEGIYQKVTSDSGRAASLAKSDKTPADLVDEIYLSIYSRFPTDEERAVATGLFEKNAANRRESVEDLMWALMNTPEFVFKD